MHEYMAGGDSIQYFTYIVEAKLRVTPLLELKEDVGAPAGYNTKSTYCKLQQKIKHFNAKTIQRGLQRSSRYFSSTQYKHRRQTLVYKFTILCINLGIEIYH
jgi:hypothetical protein